METEFFAIVNLDPYFVPGGKYRKEACENLIF
jgi:hypothetical protein